MRKTDIYSDYLLRMIMDVSRGLNQWLKKEQQAVIPTPTNAMGDDQMLPEILRGLVAQGRLDQAENLLFRCIENYPLAENFQLGLDFYRELCQLSDEELARGGWGREEIAEGLNDLSRLIREEIPPEMRELL